MIIENIQPELFEPPKITTDQLFEAYYSCRKHKRNTKQAIEFETDLETNLIQLMDDINDETYEVGPSTVFVIDNPIKQEVFAAGFRDRIVHHLVINMINPIIEKRLIYDCYACRIGKGTHFGIERLSHFMRSATENWSRQAWVLKLDVKGFFMSIDKKILWKRLRRFLIDNYRNDNLPIILGLCEQIIFNDPTVGCVFRSPRSKWESLASSKSLFKARKNCGLPIGNLTSQVFANFYMSFLDHYIKHDLGIRYYGRYVDDFFLIHDDKKYLIECRDRIELFLSKELHLKLSPSKQYLQPVSKGCRFLGVMIRPGRTLVSRRTVSNFRRTIDSMNLLTEDHKPDMKEMRDFRSSVNSYLGIMGHYDSFRVRKKIVSRLDNRVWKRIIISDDAKEIKIR